MSASESSLAIARVPRKPQRLSSLEVPTTTNGDAENVAPAVDNVVYRFARAHRLSLRERGVLALCAGGLHRKEVAFRLGCSAGTVDTYWRRIFKKTSATSQCEVLAALLTLAATGILERKHAVELASKAETTLISDNAKRDLRPHVRLHSSQYDVLIVEDDQSTRELLAQALGDHGLPRRHCSEWLRSP
jgi:DNA-binding CsgD family transcriptional regulator